MSSASFANSNHASATFLEILELRIFEFPQWHHPRTKFASNIYRWVRPKCDPGPGQNAGIIVIPFRGIPSSFICSFSTLIFQLKKNDWNTWISGAHRRLKPLSDDAWPDPALVGPRLWGYHVMRFRAAVPKSLAFFEDEVCPKSCGPIRVWVSFSECVGYVCLTATSCGLVCVLVYTR